VTVEDTESQVVRVLDHQADQEPVVAHVVGFDDHLESKNVVLFEFEIH